MKKWLKRQWIDFCITAADDPFDAGCIASMVMGCTFLAVMLLLLWPVQTLSAVAYYGALVVFVRYAARKGTE